MIDYTNKNPSFSETIKVTETTDTAHADNINAAPKQLLDNTLVLFLSLSAHTADKVSHITSTERSAWNGKMETNGNASNTTVAFTAATARGNITTGEKLSVIMGKIAKYFTDLETHFADKVSHITSAERTAWNNKVDKVTGKALSTNDYTTEEKNKLAGIDNNANKYVHPDTHPATMITDDSTHRFATDAEKAKWNAALQNAEEYTDQNYQQATAYTDEKIAALINGAPSTLDTLKEIADAMADNKSVVDALSKSIGEKANKDEFDSHLADKVSHITSTERTTWNGKLATNGNASNTTVAFTAATTRSNIATGEKLSVIMGKVAKYFTDIETHLADKVSHITSTERSTWNGKLAQTGNASDTTVAFTTATARNNIATGEKLSVIMGKIAKYFTDLKTVAFSGSYKDLSGAPTSLPASGGNADTVDNKHANDFIEATVSGANKVAVYADDISNSINDDNDKIVFRKNAVVSGEFIWGYRTIGSIFTYIKSKLATVAATGKYTDLSGTPTALKNPSALKFTGASTETYDGSAAKTVNLYGFIKSLGASVDLDTITAEGFYHQSANANTSTTLHYPCAEAGLLKVYHQASMIYQEYHTYNNSGYWFRSYYNNTWYAWKKVAVSTDSLKNPQALSFTGAVTASYDGSAAKTVNIPSYTNFGASGPNAKAGLVPTPGSTAGTSKYLREDGSWQIPPNTNTDTKVTETVVSDNANYPLLLAPKSQTTTQTTTACFDSGVTLNPSTNTINANISGNAATANKADTATSATSATSATTATTATKVSNALNLQINGVTKKTYNGSSAQTFNVTPADLGAVAKTDFDTAISELNTNKVDKNGTATIGALEIFATTPYIDFHFNNNGKDNTSRIIENSESHLQIIAANGVTINGVDVVSSINQKQDALNFAIGWRENSPPSASYTHSAGGYRINFGSWDKFLNTPSTYKKILAIIPLGIYSINDKSFVGALSFTSSVTDGYNNIELWGVGASNSMHLAQILIIYT